MSYANLQIRGKFMLKFVRYDRISAVKYATKWALSRNPSYKDYEQWGGDCTNFVSQCLHAGGIPFDNIGNNILKQWYWYDDQNRTPSWTGAQPFYQYVTTNNSRQTQNYGIYAIETNYNQLQLGDVVQLTHEDDFAYHNMIITDIILDGNFLIDYLISQHTYDLLNYPLSMKQGQKRYLKILGYYE